MSYTPTEWKTGDIVTAEKLNNLEIGVSDAQLPTYATSDIGKSLTVVQGAETVVVVPEQTVTGMTAPLTGVTIAPTDIPLGTKAVVTVREGGNDPVALNCVYEYDSEHDFYYFLDESGEFEYAIYYDHGTWGQTIADGTITISATASIPSAPSVGWEAGVPKPTADDVGKVLTVTQGSTIVDVVPEQTVVTNQEVTLNNGAMILHNAAELMGVEFTLENGPDVLNGVGSIEGEPTSMPLEKTIHGYRLTGEFPLQVMYYEADTGKWYFAWQTSAEITLSATASIPSAPSVGWEKSNGGVRVVRATGTGIPNTQDGTVIVPLDISFEEWDEVRTSSGFMPICIYAPNASLIIAPYWTYEYGGLALWPNLSYTQSFGEVGDYPDISLYMDGDSPSLIYTLQEAH